MISEWRSARRSVIQRRGLSAAIVAILALSIGASATIYSVVDAMFVKPLPYPAAEQLVVVYEVRASQPQATTLVAPARIEDWNRLTSAFAGFAGSYFENVTDTTGATPERVAAHRTSPRFFNVLGTPPALGRTFTADEEIFGGPPATVLSDRLWRTRFNADPSVVGRSLVLGGVSRRVVGIMPPSFRYPTSATEAWIPAQTPEALLNARAARFYVGIARVKPGVGLKQAQDALSLTQASLAERFPASDLGWQATIVGLRDQEIGDAGASVWLLFGAVLFVLVASCGNIASLLLVDGLRRQHEAAVQLALGAPRRTTIVQRLLEGLVLALVGSLVGLVIAYWGINLLKVVATRLPQLTDVQLDTRIAIFAVALGLLTVPVFTLLPALQTSSQHLLGGLVQSGRSIRRRQPLHHLLVATQVALAIVMLVGAGLMLRSFYRLQAISPGFDSEHVTAFRMTATWSERPQAVANRQLRTIQRVEAIPGVRQASLSSYLPLGADAGYPPSPFTIDGGEGDDEQLALARQVSGSFFQVLGLPLLQGSTCRDDPTVGATRTALVNEAFANRFFRGTTPIGHRVRTILNVEADITGLVGDAREQQLHREPLPVIYLCGLMPSYADPWFVVRADPSTPLSLATIRDAMRDIEPGRAIYSPRLLSDVVSESASQARLNMQVVTLFAMSAVALVAIGLYAVLAQFVLDRHRDIGLRLALGARRNQVFSAVFRHSARIVAAGIVVGLAAALAMTALLESLVVGISVRDPMTFAAVPAILALVAIGATAIPARRAASLDPAAALRQD